MHDGAVIFSAIGSLAGLIAVAGVTGNLTSPPIGWAVFGGGVLFFTVGFLVGYVLAQD